MVKTLRIGKCFQSFLATCSCHGKYCDSSMVLYIFTLQICKERWFLKAKHGFAYFIKISGVFQDIPWFPADFKDFWLGKDYVDKYQFRKSIHVIKVIPIALLITITAYLGTARWMLVPHTCSKFFYYQVTLCLDIGRKARKLLQLSDLRLSARVICSHKLDCLDYCQTQHAL